MRRREHIVAVAQPRDLQARQREAAFQDGLQVGDDLARVRCVGQAVDDRHAGIFGHLDDLGMIVGADHDRVAEPRQHARGIGDALAATQLHLAGFHDDGLAAELTHRDVE